MSAEAQQILELLFANLLDNEVSKLELMGEHSITEDMIPKEWRWHKTILKAFYEAERVEVPPTPVNIALLSRPLKYEDVIEKLENLSLKAGQHSVKACAIFFKGWSSNKQLDEVLTDIGKMAGVEYGDISEKTSLAVDKLLANISLEGETSHTRLSIIENFETVQKKRVELREQGQALGPVLHLHELRRLIPVLQAGDVTLLTAPPKAGKAQPLDAKVMTPNGWVNIGDIQVNDIISSPCGGTTKVIGVYPQGVKPIYEITFNDGSKTRCCDEHLWFAQDRYNKKPNYGVYSLSQMRHRLYADNGYRWRIPVTEPIQSDCKELPLDPYFLGILLGDGGLTNGSPVLTAPDKFIRNEVSLVLPEGITLKYNSQYDWRITGKSTGGREKNPVTQALRELGLMGMGSDHKFIPSIYLNASIEQRIALLQGLMDSDGSPTKKGNAIEYATASKQLAEDIQYLVRSLGGITHIKTRNPWFTYKGERREGKISYRLTVVLPLGIFPHRLPRKANLYLGRKTKPIKRAIADVQYVGDMEAVCIKVDSPDQLYVTDDFIVTHNTTTVMEIAEFNAIYNNTDVLVLLLETSVTIIEERFLAKYLLIPPKALKDGRVDLTKEPFKTQHDAYKKLQEEHWNERGRVHLQYVAGARLSTISAQIRVHKRLSEARNRPLLVIIDYLQRIPEIGGKTSVESLAVVSNGIKDIATNYGIHIILLSQESFSGVNKEQGESRAHGSNTPIFIAQNHIALRVLNSIDDIYVTDEEGNILKNAVREDRCYQRKSSKNRQSVIRYDVIRANNDEPGMAYALMENPLFIMLDISSEEALHNLPPMFYQQVEHFDQDLLNQNRRLI